MKLATKYLTMSITLTVSLYGTNGDSLIGLGAKARGMGGVGIGMSHGAESALANPAMITNVKGTEFSFGGTVFMPDVEADMGAAEGSFKSDAKLSIIPEVAVAQKVSDNFYWGIGMFGVAGMGTDYRGSSADQTKAGNYEFLTNLQLMQFGVSLAYKTNGISVGVTPVVQYGSLDINYDSNTSGPLGNSNTTGVSQDFGLGYVVGLSYEIDGLTLGASYKSAIDMEYKGQISKASVQYNYKAATGFLDDHLEQPAEIGLGASYKMGEHTFAVDYKEIQWGSAKGYKDFNWKDQDVYAIGYEYNTGAWAARLGYNHGDNPIEKQSGTTYDGAVSNLFNATGFPGIVEDHYTVGGSYAVSKQTSLDLAYVYAPEVTETYDVSAYVTGSGDARIANTETVKHSQQAVSVQLNFNF